MWSFVRLSQKCTDQAEFWALPYFSFLASIYVKGFCTHLSFLTAFPFMLVPLILCKWLTSPTNCWKYSLHEQFPSYNASGKWTFLPKEQVYFPDPSKYVVEFVLGYLACPFPLVSLCCALNIPVRHHSSRVIVILCCSLSRPGWGQQSVWLAAFRFQCLTENNGKRNY